MKKTLFYSGIDMVLCFMYGDRLRLCTEHVLNSISHMENLGVKRDKQQKDQLCRYPEKYQN